MSLPKAQLVDPQGNMNLPGMTATGIVTATSLSGIATGSATGLTGNPDLDVGIVTASSFVGQGDGHAANLTGTPQLSLGIATATSFVGDATGKAAGLTGTPNLNVGLITATSFVGFVTGNVTGNLSGTVTGLGASVKSGVNLGVGVCTAVELYGDGSTLTGAGSSAYIAQEITATGAETIIDLTYGNLIYYDSSSNTTVGFASTSAAEQITFIRKATNSYTITWPDRVKWKDGITPTLLNNSEGYAKAVQIFHLTTANTGLTYNGWEEIEYNAGQPNTLFVWGDGGYGELAQNDRTSRSSPIQVPGNNWSTINTNNIGAASEIIAKKTDGTLWSWGRGAYGELGQNKGGAPAAISSPTQIGTDTNWALTCSGPIVV